MFGGRRDVGVHGIGGGNVRPEKTTSEGLFAKQQSSRPGALLAGVGAAATESTRERCRQSVRDQQDAVNGRGKVQAEALRRRGERIRGGASAGIRKSCGEYGVTGGGGAGEGRRRRPWLSPRTRQQPLHQQKRASFAGCVGSGGGRRCTAVFMSPPNSDDHRGAERSVPGNPEPSTGQLAEEGERGRLGEDRRPSGERNVDDQALAMPVGEEAKPPLPGAAAAATTKQTTGAAAAAVVNLVAPKRQQQQREAGAYAATPAGSRQEDGAGAGAINGFELEAAAGGGEFADGEAMGPIAESYERGRWLLGLLVLQSTSSFVLDKYQVQSNGG